MKWLGRELTQLLGTVGNTALPADMSCRTAGPSDSFWPLITGVVCFWLWDPFWKGNMALKKWGGNNKIIKVHRLGTQIWVQLIFYHQGPLGPRANVWLSSFSTVKQNFIRLSQALTDYAWQVPARHNASSIVGPPNYELSFHSLLRQTLLLLPFRRSQDIDMNGSPEASYFWIKKHTHSSKDWAVLPQRWHPPSLHGPCWGNMSSFKAGTLVRSVLLWSFGT